jgi:hypothetical protein
MLKVQVNATCVIIVQASYYVYINSRNKLIHYFSLDPFNTNARGVDLEDCGADNYECMTVSKKGSSFSAISRGCKKAGTCESGVTSEDGISVTTTCCQTDLCNSSNSSFKISMFTAVLMSLLSFIFVIKN